MRRPRLFTMLIMLGFALILTLATGCEKDPYS